MQFNAAKFRNMQDATRAPPIGTEDGSRSVRVKFTHPLRVDPGYNGELEDLPRKDRMTYVEVNVFHETQKYTFLNIDMAQAIKILPRRRQWPVYHVQVIPWLRMTWQGAGASRAMALAYLSMNIAVLASEGLTYRPFDNIGSDVNSPRKVIKLECLEYIANWY